MIRKLRIAWVILLVLILGWLAWKATAPLGTMSYETDYGADNYFIRRPTPPERLANAGKVEAPVVIADPVYISVFTPRPFDTATLIVEYEGEVPFMELGVRQQGVVWNFERRGVRFEALDRLDPNMIIREGDTLLWQRTRTYDSIKSFLSDLPDRSRIAAYEYQLSVPFTLSGYEPLPAPRTLVVGLRGQYSMYAYSNGEALDFEFALRDLNGQSDPDPIEARLYSGSERIATTTLADDGGVTGTETPLRKLRFSSPVPRAGVYRIDFSASDDIITDTIRTTQSRLSFSGRIWLAEAGRAPLTLFTDGSRLRAQTTNPASRQAIDVAGKKLELNETYTPIEYSTGDISRAPKPIRLERDDVTLATDGVFALSEEELIDPDTHTLATNRNEIPVGIDYVIATYPPRKSAAAQATFSISGAHHDRGAYTFLVTMPDVQNVPDGVRIRSVRVEFHGQTLWEIIRRKLSSLL